MIKDYKFVAVSKTKVYWFKSLENMAKHFNVTVSYLSLWLNKDKPMNGWVIKEVNYDFELERLRQMEGNEPKLS